MPAPGGMFGITPQEVYQQQQQGIDQSAMDMAKMDGFTAAKYAMGQVGGNLAGMAGGLMGLKNPQMEEAQQAQDIQSQIDHSTVEGLMQGAQLFNQAGNPRMAMMYQQAAQAMEAQQAGLALDQARLNNELNKPINPGRPVLSTDDDGVTTAVWPDGTTKVLGRIGKTKSQGSAAAAPAPTNPFGKINPADFTPESVKQFLATGNYGDLVPVDKTGGTRGTEAQRFKQKQQMGKDKIALKSMESELTNLKNQANALKAHKGLRGATGVQGIFPSIPGGDAAQAEVLLEEFKAATKNAGLQLVRQGGSIGAMTEKEWPIVEAMVSNIDPKGGIKQVQDQIDKVVAKMEQVQKNTKSNFDELYSESDVASEQPDTEPEFRRDASGKIVRVK